MIVKRLSKLEAYPLPRVEDLFMKLAVRQLYSKLDLSHAYKQLELHENSKIWQLIPLKVYFSPKCSHFEFPLHLQFSKDHCKVTTGSSKGSCIYWWHPHYWQQWRGTFRKSFTKCWCYSIVYRMLVLHLRKTNVFWQIISWILRTCYW